MSKKVALVGHCGPDSSFLRMAVSSADRAIKVLSVDDSGELQHALADGVDLLLLNREMPYGFDAGLGVDMIPGLRKKYPAVKIMLISNYAEAQAAAVAAGALPGFGKREIGSPRVGELLRDALKDGVAQST
jgi:hypothetical protein